MNRALIFIGLFLVTVFNLSACSAGYILRAAWEQAKILNARTPIEELLQEENEELLGADGEREQQNQKLKLVLSVRDYASAIGLNAGQAYNTFSKVDRRVLAWVVVGSKPDSFELYTWWFPFVGSVPYKGYFEKEDADAMAAELESLGYEARVRPTQAFSTLGWFNDPFLSTMLPFNHSRIANTILHELTHRSVWIKNHADFNESLANFVGIQGSISYFAQGLENCSAEDRFCQDYFTDNLEAARAEKVFDFQISDLIADLYAKLEQVFSSALSSEEKISLRNSIFHELSADFRRQYPDARALKIPNNAEIMELKLYSTKLRAFENLFLQNAENWKAFLEKILEIKTALEEEKAANPFEILEAFSQHRPPASGSKFNEKDL